MKVEIRQVAAGDEAVLAMLREEFKPDEVATFQRTLGFSETIWVGTCDDQIVVIWGLIPDSIFSAYLWSWTTSAVQLCRKTFVKLSQDAVAQMLEQYPILHGLCEGQSHWLKLLGAEFHESTGLAIPFTIRLRNG